MTLTIRLAALVAGLSCAQAILAQPKIATPLDDVVSAFRTILSDYVTPVDAARVAGHCLEATRNALAARGLRADAPAAAPETPEALRESWERLTAATDTHRDRVELEAACLRAVAQGLDANTQFLTSEERRQLIAPAGGFGAIGLELALKDAQPVVVDAFGGFAGAVAGVRRDDVILEVDGNATKDQPLATVVRWLRGKPGTSVTLVIARAGTPDPLRLEIRREIVRGVWVNAASLEGGIIHLRLRQFHEEAMETMSNALQREFRAHGDGAVKGIIVDLRVNTGGLLHETVGVAAAFLPPDAPIAETKGRGEGSSRRYLARRADYERGSASARRWLQNLPAAARTAPLVVLVSRETAVGGELVAAALQDNRRAQVVGERTAGSGTIRTVYPLQWGSLTLTTAQFLRPSGEPIEGRGVVPDVLVAHPERFRDFGGESDPALPVARRMLLGG